MELPTPRTRVSSWDKATQAPAGTSFRSTLKSRTAVVSRLTRFLLAILSPLNASAGRFAFLRLGLVTKVSQVTPVCLLVRLWSPQWREYVLSASPSSAPKTIALPVAPPVLGPVFLILTLHRRRLRGRKRFRRLARFSRRGGWSRRNRRFCGSHRSLADLNRSLFAVDH